MNGGFTVVVENCVGNGVGVIPHGSKVIVHVHFTEPDQSRIKYYGGFAQTAQEAAPSGIPVRAQAVYVQKRLPSEDYCSIGFLTDIRFER